MAQIPSRLVVATGNAGKLREFADLLCELPFDVLPLSAFPNIEAPEETGSTFAENAEIKATSYASQIGEWVIADDSGLEITFLGGAPGVHSARFGGEAAAAYDEKMQLILEQLRGVEGEQRNARFVSVIALAKPTGEIVFTVEGESRGNIADNPRGANGFGYDPIFIPDGETRTFGEMSDEEKRSVSHRGRAARALFRKMQDFTGF